MTEQRRQAKRDYMREWRRINKDHINACRRAQPQYKKDILAEKIRIDRRNHPGKYAGMAKKYRAKNGDALRAHCRGYYWKHKGRLSEWRKQWRKKNEERTRNYKLEVHYGMTLKEYQALLEKQGGVCAICRKPEVLRDKRTGRIRSLAVDHVHETGQVRGLLCTACNAGIGQFDDDCDRLRSAINYILDYRRLEVLKLVANT